VPLEQLVERLAEFSSAFDVGREWRYGVYTLDSAELLGELDLFPRAETGRVAFAAADRIEIGYWLRDDATGMGYATEAAGAALELALALPGIFRVTVHCDERNIESAAIPRRLGFRLAATIDEPAVTPGAADIRLQIWEYSRAESAER
jgi:RimJ/RimL family protein N-acetyltransferase